MTDPRMTPTNDAPVTARYLSDRFKWAAPGDRQFDVWLVRFDDADVRDMVFKGPEAEAEAWAAWERHAPGYNMRVFRLAALAPAPAGDGEHLTYDRMGSGGRCDWRHLREAVSEAVRGVREVERDERSDIYTGHRTVPQINFNSLDRIVTAFVDAALDRPRAAVGEQSREGSVQCRCACHTLSGIMHVQPCCDRTGEKFAPIVRVGKQSPPAKVEG